MITRRTVVAGAAAAAALRALPAYAAPEGDAEILARLLGLERALGETEHAARLEQTILEIGGTLPAPAAPGVTAEELLREWVAAIGRLTDARWVQLGASIAGSHAQRLALRDGLGEPFIAPR